VSGLSSLDGTDVFINTGRDRQTIGDWFEGVDVSLIAEHGSWIKLKGDADWKRTGDEPDLSWQDEAMPILEDYKSRTPGVQIEKKSSGLVWHYREAESDIGEFQALDLTTHLENTLAGAPVEILTGSKIVEIRQYGVDKGRAYNNVTSIRGPYDFVLAIGDDRTDEDLFEAIGQDGFTVHVGPGGSLAASSLHSPASVRRLLAHLVNARSQ
jgi:trehalose 6-phosphate synthase/phosphatase